VFDPQLTGLAVGDAEIAEIEACLDDVRSKEDIETTCLLVLDHSGQVLASRSRKNGPNVYTVGALLAGNFASSREIARALREPDFRTLIQLGEYESFFAELIGDQWILAVMFRKQSQLGLVKLVCKKTVPKLEEILEKSRRASRDRDRKFKFDFSNAGDAIDQLFSQLERTAS
jgi:predicted regulator of Ras-like GTPase activity (Roadblock/LC7/MglB family)